MVRTSRYNLTLGDAIEQVKIDLDIDTARDIQNTLNGIFGINPDTQLADSILNRFNAGLIKEPEWFFFNVINYQDGKITATELVNSYNFIKSKGILVEIAGAIPEIVTTQAEEPTSTQTPELPPMIVLDPDRPIALPPITTAPIFQAGTIEKSTIDRVIAGLFMGGVALAFLGGIKKK